MKTIYLRYISQDDARDALAAILGWEPDTTTGELSGTRYDVDEVGVLYAPTPEDAAEDDTPEAREGWHVNVLWWGEDDAAPDFGAGEIEPGAASRVFATTPPSPPPVPDRISNRQFRLRLLEMGLLDTVEAWIAAQPRAVRVAYEASATVERTDAMMQMGFDALGLTGEQVDAFFIAAAQL